MRDGVGLPKDPDAALEPFRKACSLGKKEGCENAAPKKKK
jgi:TPR repeat protein